MPRRGRNPLDRKLELLASTRSSRRPARPRRSSPRSTCGWAQTSIEQDGLFKRTVADLSRPEVDAGAALTAAKSSADFEAAIGFAALAARAEIPPEQTSWAVRALSHCSEELEPFVFAMLAKHAEYPVIGPALTKLDDGVNWVELASFIGVAGQPGEDVTAETFRRNVRGGLAPNSNASSRGTRRSCG